MNQILLTITASMFYALATLLLALGFSQNATPAPNPHRNNAKSHLFSIIVALGLHALLLSGLLFTPQGLSFGFFNSLTLFAWIIAIASIIIGLRNRLEYIGLIVFPICIISMALALIFPATHTRPPDLSLLLEIHILLSILAYCLLSLAGLLALILAVQDYQLHQRKTGLLADRLPPLQTTEILMFRIITVGFALLTLALISGFMFTEDWFNHKILFSCIAWCVFLILLAGRYLAGWRGRIAIRWTLAGMIALMLAFFGTKLVLEFILGR